MSQQPRVPNKLDVADALELYKELGEYERHFNRIESLYRGLASTWFLASFAGIGFLYSKDFGETLPFQQELVASFAALAGGTGIFLLWLLDVRVYHRLLVAVVSISEELETTLGIQSLPSLRKEMASRTERFNVRKAISIFYMLPTFILWLVSLGFLLQSFGIANKLVLEIAAGVWLFVLFVFGILVLILERRPSQEND